MSPNPPMTPSSISNSDSSPMTALTSPLSSGRSSSGQHPQYQKQSTQAPPSPAVHSHHRSKSYSSVPIPLTLPSESSPMPEHRLPSASSYEPVSKNHLTHARKSTTSDALAYARDQYRRSETFSTHQTPSLQKNTAGTLDFDSAYTDNQPNAPASNGSQGQESTTNKRDSWREKEQFLLQLQQRDHQIRAKSKRDSFHANVNQNGMSNGGEESRRSSKTHSRPPSPHLSSGIPQPRTKSRSGIPSTPTAEYKGRPTPPPRSRSRTPAGSSAQPTEPTLQTPQVPRQYSGEYSSSLRKSLIMTAEDTSSLLRPEHHRSPVSSTPNSKSGTPLPQTADTIPVPVANMTKHLSSLDIKDSGSRVAFASGEGPLSPPASLSRFPSGTNRRSILFDIPNAPVRSNANGSEASAGKMKDVGVTVSSGKERLSMIAGGSKDASSSSIRKRGKVKLKKAE